MNFQPDPMQTLFLWSLLFKHEGAGLYKDIKPKLTKNKRDQLMDAGLLEREGKPMLLTLTDAGWAWAAKNMSCDLSGKSQASGPVLQALLTRLGPFLASREITLAELFLEQVGEGDIPAHIRNYWLQVTGGRRDIKVRIGELRNAITDIDQNLLTSTLIKMHKTGELVLSPLEDPRDVTKSDKEAAITIAGEANHIFFME